MASIIAVCLASQAAALGFEAADPTTFTPDARMLALGRASTAIADKTASIYTNPAGLAREKGWEWSSMSGRLVDEYNYLSFSGLYSTQQGTIGLGYTGTSITGGIPTKVSGASSPLDPVYEPDPSRPLMGYSNNALTLAYGREINDRLSLGASVKLFNTSVYGGGITNGNASGNQVDLGLQYQPEQEWLSLGVTAKNVVGSRLTYSGGHSEEYPTTVTFGGAVVKDAVKLALDLETNPSLGLPLLGRLGAEWQIDPRLAVRAGLRQDVLGDTAGGLNVVNDISFGVGLNLAGYRFDYAYVPSAGVGGSNYFSVSYSADEPAAKPVEKKEEIKLKEFPDVPKTYWAYKPITLLATANVISGYIDGTFQPEGQITRAELCTLLMKTEELKNLRTDEREGYIKFSDVNDGHWAGRYINRAAELGVIKGYEDGSFRPKNTITRAEGLAMIARYAGVKEEAYLGQFGDVQSSHWAAKTIAGAHRAGLLKFLDQRPFQPGRALTRAEAAELLYQAKPALIPEKYRGII